MLHDYFHLSSSQRREAETALRQTRMTLRALINTFEEQKDGRTFDLQHGNLSTPEGSVYDGPALAPSTTAHSAQTFTGPYPSASNAQATRGRPESVRSLDFGGDARGKEAATAKSRAGSWPPGLRVPDAYTPSEMPSETSKDKAKYFLAELEPNTKRQSTASMQQEKNETQKNVVTNPFAMPPLQQPLQPAETSIGRLSLLEKQVQGKIADVESLLLRQAPNRH